MGQTTVTGQNLYGSLGTYALYYPFTNYSDLVNPDGQGMVAFLGNQGNAAVAYDGPTYETVFLGFPFEAIPLPFERAEVLSATVDFFGGCGCLPVQNPAFAWSPEAPLVDQEVTFVGTADGMGPISYTWAFGDGMTGSGQVTNHTYTTAGTYTVVMTATNCGTATAVISHDLFVAACDPATGADFNWSPPVPVEGEVVSFSGTATGTLPIAYAWDLGDGGVGSGQTVTHTYAAAGAYPVVMTATNFCGEDAAGYTVTVVTPCVAVDILTATAAVSGCQASFTAAVTGTAPLQWLWWFGDGVTSTAEMPVHSYGAAGIYTATLEVWNCDAQGYDVMSFPVVVEACGVRYEIYLPVVYKDR